MKAKIRYWEVWVEDNGSQWTLCQSGEFPNTHPLPDAKLLHEFAAATTEEANAVYNLWMGYSPYQPIGNAKLCPNNCGSHYYPDGSSECPCCGVIE